jgi:hypothetical protein
MSDQADNLRQLVRARRQWREIGLEVLSSPARQPRPRRALLIAGDKSSKSDGRADGKLTGQFLTLAARWAWGRIGR